MEQKLNQIEKEFIVNSMALGAKQFKDEIKAAAKAGRNHIFHENFVDMLVENIGNILCLDKSATGAIIQTKNTESNE